MATLRLALRSMQADIDTDDDTRGDHLRKLVVDALGKGGAPPTGVVWRRDRLDLMSLQPVAEKRIALPMLLAGLSRSTAEDAGPVDAVGLMGVFRARRSPKEPGVPVALVFLEWPDCRWWHGKALLETDGTTLREQTATCTTAARGDALPRSLGRWWSLGRRRALTVHLRRRETELPPLSSDRIH